MAQNIYDNPDFFAAYGRLPRQVQGLHGAPEWPAMRALLPEMTGRRVLDLGCGFGWFCRWARGEGASAALGIDLSERMLDRARAMTADAAIEYRRADLDRLDLPATAFDVAYSSLALHYLEHLDALFATLQRALAPGGTLVFSVEHPIYTAPRRPGWQGQVWPVDQYLSEGPRSTDWLARGVIKQHRTIATYVNLLLGNGFDLAHVDEWGPSAAQIAAEPQLALERERPPFLILAARRSRRNP